MARVGAGSRALIGLGRHVGVRAGPIQQMRGYCGVKTEEVLRAEERKEMTIVGSAFFGGVIVAYLFCRWWLGSELDKLQEELDKP